MATSPSGVLPSHYGVPARVPPSRPYYQKEPLPVCRACSLPRSVTCRRLRAGWERALSGVGRTNEGDMGQITPKIINKCGQRWDGHCLREPSRDENWCPAGHIDLKHSLPIYLGQVVTRIPGQGWPGRRRGCCPPARRARPPALRRGPVLTSSHVLEREDEYSSVLKGEMGFPIADAEFTARPGWYMLKPQRVRS
jgi:hypothetical protein